MPHPHRFRFGVINETPLPADAWIRHVRRAEELGYDTFLIRDHFVPDYFGDQLDPIAAMMAAAATTTTIRVGTLVLDNDYRHPVPLAKAAATIDHLSGGRLELGIGAGWLQREYHASGIEFAPAGTRISRLEESIQVLKGLFEDSPFTFSGNHYRIDSLDGFPKPVQRPRPPLLIGGGKRRMLQLAGRDADIVSLLTTSVATGTMSDDPTERLASSIEEKLGWIRDSAGERFPEIELSLIPSVIITGDRRGSADALIRSRGWDGFEVEDVLKMPSILIGTTGEIVEQMHQRREWYGFSYYVFSDAEMEAMAPVVQTLGAPSAKVMERGTRIPGR